MPTIQITNNSALNLSAQTDALNATVNRYLKAALTLKAPSLNDAVSGLKVSDMDAARFPVTLTATGNTQFAAGPATLSVAPGVSGAIGLIVRDDAAALLSGIQVPGAGPDALVSFAVTGSVSGGASGSAENFSLGLTANASVTITSFVPAKNDESFTASVKAAAEALTIPRDLDDLRAVPEGAVCQVDGASSLQFTASVSYSFLNNPVATVSIPKLPSIAVNARADATVEATATHSSDHTVTIARVAKDVVHLSVSLTRTDDLESSLTVTAGLSADVGSTDALGFLLKQIAPDSVTEMEAIQKNLPADQAEQLSGDVRKALDSAVASALQASLKAAVEESRSTNRLFLYEIDLEAIEDAGRAAVLSALRGDFAALTGSQLAGVKELDSALTAASAVTHSLAVHLLGIFNYGDTHSFVETSRIDFTKDTHEIVISDERIQVMTSSLRAEKVREVVLKGMTLTLPAAANTPEAATPISLVFFDREGRASAAKRRQFVNVLQLLGSREAGVATGLGDFGVCSLYLGLDLTPQQCRQLFLDASGQARDWTFFAAKVCEAQRAILSGDGVSEARLRLFGASADIWPQIAEAGAQPNVIRVLKNAGISEMEDADAITTLWWSQAMGDYARALATGQSLENVGKKVANQSSIGFNEPWAIVAAWMIVGRPQVKTMFASSKMKPVMAARGLIHHFGA